MKMFFPDDFEKKQVDDAMRDITGTVLKRLVTSLVIITVVIGVAVLLAVR